MPAAPFCLPQPDAPTSWPPSGTAPCTTADSPARVTLSLSSLLHQPAGPQLYPLGRALACAHHVSILVTQAGPARGSAPGLAPRQHRADVGLSSLGLSLFPIGSQYPARREGLHAGTRLGKDWLGSDYTDLQGWCGACKTYRLCESVRCHFPNAFTPEPVCSGPELLLEGPPGPRCRTEHRSSASCTSDTWSSSSSESAALPQRRERKCHAAARRLSTGR
ncbi:PREDICTED: uncharacterized protein LOC102020693 [Chinchilla lanigera]|uniref:uncharacterized protein LOC102020693 n=1 Tax=Chinchilla lanigera TaxID=34839 RepID=UPI00038EE593|nr:PREDICTED: uncharacterized protein LOC102020693 [Chinchilla lanigera]